MENQNESKMRNYKFNFILVILIILCSLAILSVITLCYLLLKQPKDDTSSVDSIQEKNPPLISVIPNEKTEIDDKQNIPEENIVGNLEDSGSSSLIESENTIPDVNSNISTNTSTNSTVNFDTDTNLPQTDNTSTDNNASNISPSDPSTPVTKPYIVKTETSTELKTENKYGVIIKTYTTSTYDVYSDGTKKITNSSDKIEYDRTGYNATTAQLLPEAKTTRNQYSSMINQVFKNVNSYREEANSQSINGITNRNPLLLNEDLCVAACVRALEMGYSSKFTHTRPNGSKFYSILDEMSIEYMTAGENISYGYSDANSVSEGWKNSEGHYKNMISHNFSQIGIGVFKIEGTYYWVQIFN